MGGDTGAARLIPALVAVAVVLTAFNVLSPLWSVLGDPPWLGHTLGNGASVAMIAGGIVAARQPWGRRTGVALLIMAILYSLHAIHTLPGALPFTIRLLIDELALVVAALAAITFPDGRLRTGFERVVVAAICIYEVAWRVATTVTYDPADWGCDVCARNLLLLVDERTVHEALWRVLPFFWLLQAALVGVIVARRWRAATRPEQRIVAPIYAAIILNIALSLVDMVPAALDLPIAGALAEAEWQVARPVAMAFVTVAILAGLLRTKMARAAVADLVARVGVRRGLDGLERDVAAALGDDRARVLRWDAGSAAYLDADRRPVALPTGAPSVATPVDGTDGPLGAIVHDVALHEYRPELVDSVVAAVRLALHNERLAEDVRAQLDEVRRSRRRLVEVADEERRRMERDLHDGAQQYLIALNLEAGAAARRAAAVGDDALAAQLRDVAAHAGSALHELRTLARGIRPPVLTDLGLAGALQSLTERFPVPVTADVALDGRADDVVEATAYFVAAEALTNVLKYAEAGHVHLSATCREGVMELLVEDDGRGGAGRQPGSGIRGLRDRVEALGGTLDIDSPVGEGTRLHARIPLQPDVLQRPHADDEAARR